jgi:hypothetical protein
MEVWMARRGMTIEQSKAVAIQRLKEFCALSVKDGGERRIRRGALRAHLHYYGLSAFLEIALAALVHEKVIEYSPEGAVYIMPEQATGDGGEALRQAARRKR